MESVSRVCKYLSRILFPRAWIAVLVTSCLFGNVSLTLTPSERQGPARLPSHEPNLSELDLRTNAQGYPNGQVPQHSKFEVSFALTDTVATNPYFSTLSI